MAFVVEDRDEAAAALDERGRPELLFATTTTGTAFAFHDARATHGHLVEIYERTERLAGFHDLVRRSWEGWTGDDPIRSP